MTLISRLPSCLFCTRTVTLRDVLTFLAFALKLTLDIPADMDTLEGTDSTVELLLDNENVKPFDGATAPATRLIVITLAFPLCTVDGFAVTLP